MSTEASRTFVVERSIAIDQTAAAVFAFVRDPMNDRRWCPKVRDVRQLGGDGPAPDAHYEVVHRPVPVFFARTMRHTLVSWVPDREIRWHEDDGHDEIDVRYTLRETPGGTHFTQTDHVTSGAPRLLHPLIRRGIGHDLAGQLRRLKRLLESAESDEGRPAGRPSIKRNG